MSGTCTNCGHPKTEHRNPEKYLFGTCRVCQLIDDGNTVNCQDGYSEVPGGSFNSSCTGFGGHKSWCAREKYGEADLGVEGHFSREIEDTRAMNALEAKVRERSLNAR